MDPFANPERDVGSGLRGLLRDGATRRLSSGSFLGEPCRRGGLLATMLVEGSTPTAAQVGQFIKFDEISSSHGYHTLGAAPPSRSCLDYMRRSGAPCSSAEHL